MGEATREAEALLLNDELVDMLMVLNYDSQDKDGFCDKEHQPMSRQYFAYPAANSSQQFKYFTQLCSWLLKLIQKEATWGKYDDPNTICTNLCVELTELGVPEVPPGKLKSGSGEGVCHVLHGLSKEVLKRVKTEWGGPTFPEEALADEVEVEDDSVDEDDHLANEEEEEDLIYCEAQRQDDNSVDEEGIMEAHVDPQEWALELERVTPKLKVTLQMSEGKEWRNHLVQTRQYHEVINKIFPETKSQLLKLGQNLNEALGRIRAKEAFINSQFDDRALIYRTQQEEFQQVQMNYNNLNETVVNLQNELRFLSDELETTKTQLEEMSSTVTDTTPIVKIKDAFQKLRKEARQLEVKIGVVSHTLMQAKLRQGRNGTEEGGLLGGTVLSEEGELP